ncbi:MAG: type II secretion system F family protein [Sedimentisphaerales bacterium]|nr:type II secretion system F family protein [Sedimentisphaerales bacterium]
MMAAFEYTAKDTVGNELSGVYANVDSVEMLRAELGKLGYVLVHAQREARSARRSRRVPQKDVASFAFKFACMYSAGLSLVRCLEALEEQAGSPVLRSILADVRHHVETGSNLKGAFEPYRRVFGDFFLGMIEAGESSGELAKALDMSARYLEKRLEVRQKVRAAFVYPTVVGAICFIVVLAMLIFVVPMFSRVYGRLHVDLPAPTRILVFLSIALRSWWWALAPSVVALVLGVRRLIGHPRVKLRWDRWKMRVPLLGPLNRFVLVGQFVRTFGMLISVGVPIMEAIESAGRVVRNAELSRIAADLQQAVRVGHPVAESLQAHALFPSMVVQLVASGEEAGVLPDMLAKAADLLDKEADRMAASLLVKLEPLLTVAMGAVIGLILMGVYLPMFDYMARIK